MLYLTDMEAAELYELWHEKVGGAVRRAHAKANGRRDTHEADLAALRRSLTSRNLHAVEVPEPEAVPGTALSAAQAARRFLGYAEEDHANAEHLPAILWLQAALMGAELAIDLDKRTTAAPAITPSAIESEAAAWWHLNIPRQRPE